MSEFDSYGKNAANSPVGEEALIPDATPATIEDLPEWMIEALKTSQVNPITDHIESPTDEFQAITLDEASSAFELPPSDIEVEAIDLPEDFEILPVNWVSKMTEEDRLLLNLSSSFELLDAIPRDPQIVIAAGESLRRLVQEDVKSVEAINRLERGQNKFFYHLYSIFMENKSPQKVRSAYIQSFIMYLDAKFESKHEPISDQERQEIHAFMGDLGSFITDLPDELVMMAVAVEVKNLTLKHAITNVFDKRRPGLSLK